MPCSITAPGHATNLAGVKVGLALLHDPNRTPVPAEVVTVDEERITLRLAGGTVEARCHDAARLDALLGAARATGSAEPRALFSAHEHQLFVEVDPDHHPRGIGTEYVAHASSTGVLAAFNLALPWHPDVPCGRRAAA
jgi:ribosomal protein S18 acetylase RimI-like enzyme